MHLLINAPVTVAFVSWSKGAKIYPISLQWDGRLYKVTKIGFHHRFRQGRTLHHIFSVLAGGTFFKINLDTESLLWRLEEISDGLPD